MIRRKERERERLGGKICAGNPQSTDAGQVLKRWTDSAGSIRAITHNVGINRDARLPSWPSATSPYQTSTIASIEIITNAKCDYFLFPDSLSTFSPAAGQQRAELCAFNPSWSLPSVGEGRTGWHQPALQNFRRGRKKREKSENWRNYCALFYRKCSRNRFGVIFGFICCPVSWKDYILLIFHFSALWTH